LVSGHEHLLRRPSQYLDCNEQVEKFEGLIMAQGAEGS
jgi:hypothetical protein